LGSFKVDKEIYQGKIDEIKKKYLPNLKQSLEKEEAGVNLAKAAISCIKHDKPFPNDLLKKFKKLEKYGQSNNSMIKETHKKRSSNQESMETPNINLMLPKLESALQVYKEEAKHKKEMINVINGKWKSNMEYLDEIKDELEDKLNNN